MKALLTALAIPFVWMTRPLRWLAGSAVGRWFAGSLFGRYLRAMSPSARYSCLVVAGLGFAVFGLSAASGPPVKGEVELDAVPVVAKPAELRALAPEIYVFGRVENPNTTTLEAATLAYVSEVNVREGQQVRTGDVLMRLDDRDARLALQRAEAALAEARGEFERVLAQQRAEVKNAQNERRLFELTVNKQERYKTLYNNGQISATDLETLEQQRLQQEIALNQQDMLIASHDAVRASAEARVARAEADRDQAALNLERLTLIAPFDGTIIGVDAAIGRRVVAGQGVITLFDQGSQQVRVSLPARQALAVRDAQTSGAPVKATARLADRWIDLELLDIGSEVRTGRAGTDVLFSTPGHPDLALGRAVDVKITLPERDNLLEVPVQGVYADRIIYTVRDGLLHAVDVERVGVREDAEGNMSLLVSAVDIEPGEPVVTSALSRATSGTKVSIIGAASEEDTVQDGAVSAAAEAVAAR